MSDHVTPNNRFKRAYVRRIVDDDLDKLMPALPAIHLDGPKAVGKTATASQRAKTLRRLSDPQLRVLAESDPGRLTTGSNPVLIDEWQLVPATWDAVKVAVDADSAGGRFLLTGSLPKRQTHSGAGRITTIRMRPLSLPERGVCSPTVSLEGLLSGDRAGLSGECALTLEAYTDLIVASGFPGFQHLDGANLRIQLDSYIARIVDADMESESGRAIRMPSTVMAWLRAYAAATSTTMSWEKIRDTAHPGKPPARSTAIPYRDILTRLRILDAVEPWTPGNNHMKTMSQVPKHHLADPALAARLVGLEKGALLDGAGPSSTPSADPFLGQLFESLVALSLRVFVGTSGATVQHLRTHRGTHEIDYIVKRGDGKVVAVEVKLSPNVDDKSVRHLTWLRDEIGASLLDAAVITTGAHAYRRTDGIAVIPLGLLGP